jgi:chromosome segregation ATPase
LKSKVQEMQKRETKIVNLEEELKSKIHEVSRKLAEKEEEIINIKKRFKEEKMGLLNDKKNLKQQVDDAKALLDETEERYRIYRKDMEESPLSVLRTELGKKNIEIAELNAKLQKSNEEIASGNNRFKKLRIEHTKLRREMERQREESSLKQAEELEKLKMEMRNQNLAEQDRQEILFLKEELTSVQTKLLMKQDENQKQQPMYMTGMSSDGFITNQMQNSNPFGTQNMLKQTKMSQNRDTPSKQQKEESRLEALKKMKKDMMSDGFYNEHDDLVIQLDDEIKREQSRGSPNRDSRLSK